jgi:hypothetical protein
VTQPSTSQRGGQTTSADGVPAARGGARRLWEAAGWGRGRGQEPALRRARGLGLAPGRGLGRRTCRNGPGGRLGGRSPLEWREGRGRSDWRPLMETLSSQELGVMTYLRRPLRG